MPSGGRNFEVEIKLPLAGPAQGRRLLRRHRFRLLNRRAFEENDLYDTPNRDLRNRGQLLRLRRYRGESLLTFKGRPEPGRHKSREELELEIPQGEVFERILRHLGLERVFRYEKFRAQYSRPGEPGLVTLDETPIGHYLELEGPPAWIDATARRLGFRESDYITASFAALYYEHCRQQGLSPSDMVFSSGDRPKRRRKGT